MTTPIRVVHVVAITSLAFLARWVHTRYRAPVGVGEDIWRHLLLGLMFAIVAAVLASPPRTTRMTHTFLSALTVSATGLGISATVQLFFPNTLPRFSLLFMALACFVWLQVTGAIGVAVRRRRGVADRVVAVISETDATALVADAAPLRIRRRFRVVAVITDEDGYDDIIDTSEATDATVLVLGRRALLAPGVTEQAAILHQRGLRVRSIDSFYDERLERLPISSLDSFALMGDIESLHGPYAPVKRAIDLILATLGALLLLVLMPIVLLGNLIANRGPLLFRQDRVGLFGEPFSIVKLRTMTPGAVDVSGWTSNDDPRITGFGRILRRTHVDELPQVLNIFVGELSVVGPRPEQVAYVRRLEQTLPFYSARHLVPPGLTGWAQVKYPYAASEEDAFVKLQYDLHYVRHESFATDVKIIALTLRHVLFDGGR